MSMIRSCNERRACVFVRSELIWMHMCVHSMYSCQYLVLFLFLPPFLLHGSPSLLLLYPLFLQFLLPLLQLLLIVLPGSLLTCLPLGLSDSCDMVHARTHTQLMICALVSLHEITC